MISVVPGPDGEPRCSWGVEPPEYLEYHDTEWGFPVLDRDRLFEKICLEGFQSGLSWLTILRKREGFRRAFHGFRVEDVAAMDEAHVESLLADTSIIRHRGKIEATINNARRVLVLEDEGEDFVELVWRFQPEPGDPHRATAPESEALAKELKRRGFRFIGPTTVYAFMQAMGLVNDHLEGCWVRDSAEAARGSS